MGTAWPMQMNVYIDEQDKAIAQSKVTIAPLVGAMTLMKLHRAVKCQDGCVASKDLCQPLHCAEMIVPSSAHATVVSPL